MSNNTTLKTLRTLSGLTLSGLTRMDRDPHNYDGFAVRRTKNHYRFLQYVGAGVKLYPTMTHARRFAAALDVASGYLKQLDEMLADPKSWKTLESKKSLTKKTVLAINGLGFRIKFPVA